MNLLLLNLVLCSLGADPAAADVAFFETRIRPLLVEHCYECHSTASVKLKADLLVDFRDGLLKGGETGPAVTPGKPAESLLLEALRYESLEMPPAGKLPQQVIADFERWIRRGAVDPRETRPTPAAAAAAAWKIQLRERRKWWSLQPPQLAAPPAVSDSSWSREPIDRFVWRRLTAAGLRPAPPADGTTLLRRLSFVLTGLPPSPERVESFPQAFARDPDAALAQLVDELLASPHYGERFARRWMDVVRYTDTYGYEWDNPAKGSWEYRDYLIRAFNNDVGFDQMIREQVAGDLLPHPRTDAEQQVNESLIGPMFYHLGEHRHGGSLEFNGVHQEMINNKIDAFSKAFLATTAACARCHDHKLDAVSQADYYAMAGVFMSPRWTSRVIDVDGKFAAEIAELKRLRRQIQRSLTKRWREEDVDLLAAVKKWSSENRPAIDAAKIEQISHVLKPLATADDKSIGPAWKEMADAWKQTRSARLKGNEKFQLVTDFAEPGLPPNWLAEGAGVANGYVRHGTVLVSLAGDEIVRELLHRGYHTSALSSKLPGAIRLPPQDELAGKFIGLNLRGGEWAGYLVVPQNAFQSEAVTFLDPQSRAAKWLSIADSGRKHGVTRVLTEIVTSSLNPNFPPRTGLAKAASTKLPDDDDGFDKRSWFSLTGVVRHDDAGAPADTLDVYQPLFSESPPTSMNMAWTRIERWCQSTLDRWANDKATASDVQLLNWLLSQQLLPNRAADSTELAELSRQYREVESRIGFPRTVNSMDERSLRPVDYRLNVRGNVHDEGAAIHRDFLQVFADQHGVGKSRGSGRLELAEYLGGNRNPQTARVFVNRVWHWMLGAGIVATPSDFGRLGDRPSHPQLLDWLAIKFMEENWSTKRLVRRLALSQTFLQSTTTTRAAWDIDPQNRLLHHYPTRRLEAEEIRDNMLAVSGSLNRELYGRPIDPPRTVEDSKKRLFSGPLDSHGRRSIYMKMSIMDPPKFLVCFNLPDLKLPTGRRDITNGPTQALALLNDPLVVKLSADWGERLSRDPSKTPQERVRAMFVRSLGRPPREAELERWTAAAQSFSNDSDLMADKNAWSELAHAFFNIKEFIYYR